MFARSVLVCGMLCTLGLVQAQQDHFRWPNGAEAAVCLTYDDGVDIHLDHAAPDLEAVNIRGTFYVPGQSRSLYDRMEEWRALAEREHELGNHSIFHPCQSVLEDGSVREWLTPERALEKYTVTQMAAELRAMNTTLTAVDGKRSRTYAYTCSDHIAGENSFVDALRPLFFAARTGDNRIVSDLRQLDLHFVPSWAVIDVSGDEMIAFVEKALKARGVAVFMFHGVGGGHNLNIERAAHRKLLEWLASHRGRLWTDTFHNVMTHVVAERQRLGWKNPRP
jgi:sialate O-acetylesterase